MVKTMYSQIAGGSPPRVSLSCRLPQEILDAIVDCVRYRQTLKNMALASSLFLKRTRRILFHRISVEPRTFSIMEERFSSSSYASCIKHLILRGSHNPRPEELLPAPLEMFQGALTLFFKAEYVSIFDFVEMDSGISACSLPLNVHPSVTKLTMHSVHARFFSSIARVIASFPNLTDISVHFVSWDNNDHRSADFQSLVRDMPKLRINKLDVWATFMPPVNEVLFPVGVDVQLREAHLWTNAALTAEDWAVVLERAGQTLQQITIRHTGESAALPLNLKMNTALQSLEFPFVYAETIGQTPPECAWISQTLETVNSRCLERIKMSPIELGWVTDLDYMLPREIDRILSNEKQFGPLKCLDFSMIVRGAVDQSPEACAKREEAKVFALSCMPRLSERGLLHISTGYYEPAEDDLENVSV